MHAHISLTGFVQGVGFRKFIKNNAKKLQLMGWVTNSSNKTVEAVFQGEKKAIEKMITLCWKGPFLSEVKNIHVNWDKQEENYKDFIIVI